MEENKEVNNEKKRIINKILIAIIIVLVIMLAGLSYYTFFVRDTTKNVDNKTTDKETDNSKETDNQSTDEESGYTTLFEKYGDFNYIKTPTKVDLVAEAVLGKVEKDINDLTKEDWQQFVLTRAIVFTKYKEIEPSKDCDKISSEEEIKKYMACYLGMTNTEIAKVDISIFESQYGGSTGYMSYSLNDIKNEIVKIYGSYGNMFDNSINFTSTNLLSDIFYDKNLDKVFLHWSSSPQIGISGRYIVSKNSTNDSYNVEYFDYEALENLTDVNGNVVTKVDDLSNIDKILEKNVSKFPKKIVTFKLLDGVYKYDSEKDV